MGAGEYVTPADGTGMRRPTASPLRLPRPNQSYYGSARLQGAERSRLFRQPGRREPAPAVQLPAGSGDPRTRAGSLASSASILLVTPAVRVGARPHADLAVVGAERPGGQQPPEVGRAGLEIG